MEDTDIKIEWQEFRAGVVAFYGEEIVAILRKAEDFPCEAYTLDMCNGMYTTLAAAKADAEPHIRRFIRRSNEGKEPPKPQPNMYLEVLRAAVKALEALEAGR